MANYNRFTFHENQNATGDGSEYTIKPNDEVIIFDITTDASALTVNFEAQGENGNWISIACENFGTTDGTLAINTTSIADELWKVDILGLIKFRTRISAQTTSGNGTTIVGKIIGRM